MELLEQLLGRELGMAFRVATAFVIVLLLIVSIIWIMRRIAGSGIGTGARGRQQRLAVVDYAMVDNRRRLILVRRDHVEHLVLIGGQTDTVIEQNIARPGSVAAANRSETTLLSPPAGRDDAAVGDLEPTQAQPQSGPPQTPPPAPQMPEPPQSPPGWPRSAPQPSGNGQAPTPQPQSFQASARQDQAQRPPAAPPAQRPAPQQPAGMSPPQTPSPSQQGAAPSEQRSAFGSGQRLSARTPQWGSTDRSQSGGPFGRFQNLRTGATATVGATAVAGQPQEPSSPTQPASGDTSSPQAQPQNGSIGPGTAQTNTLTPNMQGHAADTAPDTSASAAESAFIPELDFLGAQPPQPETPGPESKTSNDASSDPSKGFLSQLGSKKT
ncbi:MAG: flagellar biosynthetic protein FliO [Pseudomonadota bacterium]